MSFKFRYPLVVLVFTFLLYAAQYAPPYYALNSAGPDRLRNIIYMSYIWFIMINGFYFVGWLGRLMRSHDIHMEKFPRTQAKAIMLIILVVFLADNAQSIHNTAAYKSALDLRNGTAARFAAEMNARYELLNNPDIQDVVLKPIENYSDTLYRPVDITGDPNHWLNQEVADYYQKNSVIVRED